MNFRHLKFFVATAELGQVSRAATQLSISQSAVTNAIKELETELGAPLFFRTASGMEMTEAGRDFLASSREILEKLDQAKRIAQKQSPVRGLISIAATYTVIGYFLPPHLDRLKQIFPNLNIKINELSRESIEEGLLSNRFDLAVVLTSNITNVELETQTLLKSQRRLWASNSHDFIRQGKATFEDISQQDYIMLTVDEAAHTTMRYWAKSAFQPKVTLRTSSVEAVRSMVANGQGVTILSDMVYRPWSLEGKRIGTVLTDHEIPSMDVGLAWQKGEKHPRHVSSVIEYFNQTYLAPA